MRSVLIILMPNQNHRVEEICIIFFFNAKYAYEKNASDDQRLLKGLQNHFTTRCQSCALHSHPNKQAPCTSSMASSVANTAPPLSKWWHNRFCGAVWPVQVKHIIASKGCAVIRVECCPFSLFVVYWHSVKIRRRAMVFVGREWEEIGRR